MRLIKYVKDNKNYMVTSEGEVYGLKSMTKLKPRMNNMGYLRVNISGKERLVHDLVAEAFLDKPEGCTIVNHKDENKTNNNLDNLEWCTPKYNAQYSSHKLKKAVIQYSKDGTPVNYYDSVSSVSDYGYSPASVSNCCNNKITEYKGYLWAFAERTA